MILAMMARMCFGGLSAQEQERDLERVFIPEARVKAIEVPRAEAPCCPPGLAFCRRFCVAKFARRIGAGQRQTLGGEPRPQNDHFGLSGTHHRVRHVGRFGCSWESLCVEPHQCRGLRRYLDITPVVAGWQCAGDSVALSFWYQSGGIANGADAGEDSLIVEFRNTAEDDPWQWVWSTEGIDDDTAFHPVVIPIVGTEYFHNEFQFRILNYGALEGNVDTWHLDFVRVDEDGMEPAPLFEEVAFVAPPTSFLRHPWTAMPWPHFVDSVDSYTATSVTTLHRSLESRPTAKRTLD